MAICFFSARLCGGLLVLAVLTAATTPAAAASGPCNPSKGKFFASALENSTTSSAAFANIPETQITFTQAGPGASCVVVRFSAETVADSGSAIRVRALLENNAAAVPGEIQYSGFEAAARRAHSYEFIFPSVVPGSHTVRMQFRSPFGGPVYVHRHTTVVQFK